ncbi:hypothetical protein ACTPEO_05730 [Clostridioides difficile]
MKNLRLKLTSLTLTSMLLVATSTNAYATSVKSTDLDIDRVADVLTVSEEYSNLLKGVGISPSELKDLEPKGETFRQQCKQYLNLEEYSNTPKAYSEQPIKHTTNASQLSYAMSAARKNQEVGAPKYNDEVVYMYLSHFIDFEGNNYEEGLCTYITKYDREAYDQYLSRGSAFRSANSMRSVITYVLSVKSDLPAAYNSIMDVKNANLQTISDLLATGIDIYYYQPTIKNDVVPLFKDAYNKYDNPQDIISDVKNSMDIKYGDYNEQIIIATVGIMFSILTLTPPVMSMLAEVNLYSMIIKDIFDKANYAALQYSRSARKAERFNLWMEENGM